jgi:hypothetical protein
MDKWRKEIQNYEVPFEKNIFFPCKSFHIDWTQEPDKLWIEQISEERWNYAVVKL